MAADVVEDIAEIHERVDLGPFAGLDEAREDCGGSAAVVTPEEEPVFPPDGNSSEAALGAVVVDLEVTVRAVAQDGVPVHTADGRSLNCP